MISAVVVAASIALPALASPIQVAAQGTGIDSWTAVHADSLPDAWKELLDSKRYAEAMALAEAAGWSAAVERRQLILFDLDSTGVHSLELRASVAVQIADLMQGSGKEIVLHASELPDKGEALLKFVRSYYPRSGSLLTPENAVIRADHVLAVVFEIEGKVGSWTLAPTRLGGSELLPILADQPRSQIMEVVPRRGSGALPTHQPLQFEFQSLLDTSKSAFQRSTALRHVANRIDEVVAKAASARDRLISATGSGTFRDINELNAMRDAALADLPQRYRVDLRSSLDRFISRQELDGLDREKALLTSRVTYAEILMTLIFYVRWPNGIKEGFQFAFKLP